MGSRLEEKSTAVRKRIENHTFQGEDGEEYEGSKFGGFSDYFRRKKQKLQNLDAEIRSQATDKPPIFRGIVCNVNGYTQPSLNDLHTMIVQHGGGFLQYLDGKTMVTHIIASNLTPKKKEEFKRYRIVKPAWIVDSVKAGKLLPWNAYRVLDEGVAQKVLGFDNGQVVSQANRKTQSYREQTDASWYTSQLKSTAAEPAGKATFVRPTQTDAPAEDIEDDDEFSLPEITSSIEEALREAERDHSDDRVDDARNAAATSPPTSPPVDGVALDDETHLDTARKSKFIDNVDTSISGDTTAADTSKLPTVESPLGKALRPQEGSQEPDYSMAVVRDSAVLNSISPSKLAQMTAEEHNGLLLSDPKIRKSTVVNPDFLEQYYRESRLHHLSTWKADLKSQLQALAAEKTSSQKVRHRRVPGQRRYIMHVDFDSFFAAVSLKKFPQYVDKPAVVAHGGGSGSEIASCNYPARKFGVSNGMWMKRAQEMCPELKVLPYDFPAYEAASRSFYAAILATDGLVQSVSIDEALIDVSSLCHAASGQDGIRRDEGAVDREQAKADELGERLRDEVMKATGCAVSVGIGANILQAKVALRKAKPAGQYQLKPEEVLDFIGQLEVQKLPGVAWSIGGKLEEIGIKLVKDIREVSKEKLITTLGPKTGEKIWEYARGIDKTEVGDQVVRKSVSAEVNWGVRFENQEQVDEFMHGLCGELHKRLVKERVRGKQLTMKVMRRAADAPLDPPKHLGHGKCDVFNKSIQLGVATNEPKLVAKEAIAMLRSFGISPGELRGIGVQMQKLEAIKMGVEQGSQRRLQFNAGPAQNTTTNRTELEDAIQDDIKTPEKQRIPDANRPSAAFRPVDTLGTPTKKLLNTLGTQFMLPTQIDPSVLAELPKDIRARLTRPSKTAAPAVHSIPEKKNDPSRAQSPAVPPMLEKKSDPPRAQSPATFLPSHSQLDPSILDALPEDVRNEILSHYNIAPALQRRSEQALLPQSPRKARTLPPSRAQPVAKRGRGRPRGSLNINRSVRAESSTLTQSNFVARPQHRDEQEGETLDPEVLAALPEDLRQEVLAQQRQARLQRTGGIDTSRFQKPRGGKAPEAVMERHVITLPPRAAKPSFTSRKLTELGELREAVSAWFKEFEEEGPYEEDVRSLEVYLRAVVGEERDLGKACGVVGWLEWVVGQGGEGSEEWKGAVEEVREAVRDAARERGLGEVKFG